MTVTKNQQQQQNNNNKNERRKKVLPGDRSTWYWLAGYNAAADGWPGYHSTNSNPLQTAKYTNIQIPLKI